MTHLASPVPDISMPAAAQPRAAAGYDGRLAYRFSAVTIAAGILVAVAVLLATGMHIELGALSSYLVLLALLFGAHALYTHRRPRPVIGLATGSLGLMFAAALCAGIIANAGMRLRYPLVDGWLTGMDLALGFDTSAWLRTFAEYPAFADLLALAYTSIFPLVFLSAVVLSVRGRSASLWEMTAGFSVGIVVCATISVLLPAIGSVSHAGLEGLAGAGLPNGSGIYHLHAVSAYRDGTSPLLDVRKLEGVVTFPSFHMIMAIIVAAAFRSTGIIGWAVAGWCGLVAISTVPMGGHYLIDLIAGTLIWLAVRQVCRWDQRGKTQAMRFGWAPQGSPSPSPAR
jgi:hypothetical protein